MRKVLVVLRREYLYRVRNRWFVIGTLALPAVLIGGIALSAMSEARRSNRNRALRIVYHSGVL